MLPAQVRADKLRALRADKSKAVGTEKVFYKGKPERFDVFQIDLDLLIYNRHNGRIESEMLTWQFEHDIGHTDYNAEIHKLIDKFLWETNVERNKHTLKNLKEKQQQRPGIVSLDGVIIDGNRRAMLLRRIGSNQHFEAVILPDEYYENEKEIVRLETEYQIGEDSKLDYGPLEKYLKVKRLIDGLGYGKADVCQMMGIGSGELERRRATMTLMDEYLAYIDCAGLYNMLKERDNSTKEGMFVDLYADLKRLQEGGAGIAWATDSIDALELKTTQFDLVRYGTELFDSGKDYRKVSHDGRGEKSFFANEEIWKAFRTEHQKNIDPITNAVGTLDEFVSRHPEFTSRKEAAEARDDEWKTKAKGLLLGNFNRSSYKLEAENDANKPRELLERALAALTRVDYRTGTFTKDVTNEMLVKEISSLAWDMKKRFDRPTKIA
ncbi:MULTISPECIES: hypothetical protein [unclassified Mesorhizobium]|uniref:hypothetical protein n=1 Tax=unclassified Mesorhizobium TaxID=325217 RepID=UPI003335DE93